MRADKKHPNSVLLYHVHEEDHLYFYLHFTVRSNDLLRFLDDRYSFSLLYILLSIELLAEEIEEPLGTYVNDLPTGKLSQKIAADVREIFRHS